MSDQNLHGRLQEAENELASAKEKVDEQLKVVHRLEAMGQDGGQAHHQLESLLEALETAQKRFKVLRGSS